MTHMIWSPWKNAESCGRQIPNGSIGWTSSNRPTSASFSRLDPDTTWDEIIKYAGDNLTISISIQNKSCGLNDMHITKLK